MRERETKRDREGQRESESTKCMYIKCMYVERVTEKKRTERAD